MSIAGVSIGRAFLQWKGPLMAVLTILSVASFIACFAPGTAFAYGVDRASLYGGLALFGAYMIYDTQKLLFEAETQDDQTFDPINSSIKIYLDMVNLFVRIARILAEKAYGKQS